LFDSVFFNLLFWVYCFVICFFDDGFGCYWLVVYVDYFGVVAVGDLYCLFVILLDYCFVGFYIMFDFFWFLVLCVVLLFVALVGVLVCV